MTLQLTHKYDNFIDISYGDQQLFRYVYKPNMPQAESPKPYFHPLYTLRGDSVNQFPPTRSPVAQLSQLSTINAAGRMWRNQLQQLGGLLGFSSCKEELSNIGQCV